MDTVTIKDKTFAISIPSERLEEAVQFVADKMNRDLRDKDPLFLCVLNGAFIFASDLLKKVQMACQISFVKLASYQGTETTETVKTLIGLNDDLKGRTVVVVEDIVDTGITMEHVVARLKDAGAAEVKIATLFFKPDSFRRDYAIDYVGMSIPNDFIVGYGLDYDGYGRNLPHVYSLIAD
ncbi:MAG: hypoxanthine phosphoribosyltransferase [Bacteroidetes bacterium]|nr:MAG: hypoxanthine phosphoribosyltransferase [Bacteroidota bacterium]